MDYTRPEQLWDGLHANCIDARVGCDVLTIPHNGNISSGLMFTATDYDDGNPYDAATSRRRREMEPLLEIYQHKGASECTPGPISAFGSTDEQCKFELLVPNVCKHDGTDTAGCIDECPENPVGGFIGTCVSGSDFARGALRNGLAEQARTGENPFEYGFIGSTDTHAAVPGAVEEDAWQGHVGTGDDTPQERLLEPGGATPLVATIRSSPGGLAAVWSEENSRSVDLRRASSSRDVRDERHAPRGALLRRLRARRQPLQRARSARAGVPRRRADGLDASDAAFERRAEVRRDRAPRSDGRAAPSGRGREGLVRRRRRRTSASIRSTPRRTAAPRRASISRRARRPAPAPTRSAPSGPIPTSIRRSRRSTTCASARTRPAAGARASARRSASTARPRRRPIRSTRAAIRPCRRRSKSARGLRRSGIGRNEDALIAPIAIFRARIKDCFWAPRAESPGQQTR